jgi:hypothetical protein
MTSRVVSGHRAAQVKAGRGPSLLGPVLASLVLAGAAVGLGGCGDTPGQRAVSGGLIGGGVGALGGAVTAPR